MKPSWVTEDDFAALYSAAEFAHAFRLYLDTHVTFRWGVLSPEEQGQAPQLFKDFLHCFRDWLRERRQPSAWIYVHENVPGIGPHTHVALALPGRDAGLDSRGYSYRQSFRSWIKGWEKRRIGRDVAKFLHVTGAMDKAPLTHWRLLSYFCKSYDPDAVVVSARNAPGGRDIRLGDLIAWKWEDCGEVPFKKRIGVSESLGLKQRSIGVPTGLEYLFYPTAKIDPFGPVPYRDKRPGVWKRVLRPFRSKYEDGVRDVRLLYPADFYRHVTRLR